MAKTNSKPVVYSALEVANICGVVNQTAINWIRSGYLRAYTTPGGQYRVYADDLADFMRSRNMRLPQELEEIDLAEKDKKAILIVHEDRTVNNMIASHFQKTFPKSSIFQAFDAFEAGSILAEKRPICVLLNLEMPGLNGKELLKRLSETDVFGKPVVIAACQTGEVSIPGWEFNSAKTAFFAHPLQNIIPELADAVSKMASIPIED